jgi:hypothetical protein
MVISADRPAAAQSGARSADEIRDDGGSGGTCMRLGGVRRGLAVVALVVLPALGGCSAPAPAPTATALPPGDSWIVVEQGKASAGATPSGNRRSPSASPTAPLGTPGTRCPADWTGGTVLIPMTVTAGAGSVTATWPAQGTSHYRITAVPQDLVAGSQPVYDWQDVAPASGCFVTATITGLTSGKPYIVWLDAPATGADRDGTPHRYSGRSGVVYPT